MLPTSNEVIEHHDTAPSEAALRNPNGAARCCIEAMPSATVFRFERTSGYSIKGLDTFDYQKREATHAAPNCSVLLSITAGTANQLVNELFVVGGPPREHIMYLPECSDSTAQPPLQSVCAHECYAKVLRCIISCRARG